MTLTEAIGAVRAAEVGSRELDALILAVLISQEEADIHLRHTIRAYEITTDLASIVALIEKKLPGFAIYSLCNGDIDLKYGDVRSLNGWRVGIAPIGFSIRENPSDLAKWPTIYAPTAPLALCLAFLTALDKEPSL